ncbi:MAG: ABC transporter substrate-binding protein [Methylotenera sp.]|nr:ABC transporter substrate-binding protein [Methylotenera sp.]
MQVLQRNRMVAVAALVLPLFFTGCAENVLRVAPHAELKVFDPVWTTAYITRNHGYLVYDTLFALDENFEPKPQMVDTWVVSEDETSWTFKLRDGLKWHDGTDVTADDCVASLERWGKRDGAGQQLFRNIESLTAPDVRTISMKLRAPSGVVLDSLAKLSSNVPFMMPKRIAQTDPFKPIQDPTGSGPYIFKKNEWVPESKVVYVKNKNYIARSEPLSLASGGKLGKADRIEFNYYPEPAAAAQALIEGKVDYVESPSTKLVPMLEDKKNIVVATTDPLGNIAMARFNTLLPPFDNVEIRRAATMAMQQEDYMAAALGDQRFWRVCYSVFPCGTPFSNNADSEVMKATDLEAAKNALQAAKYDGTPVVILNPVDSPVISAFTKVTAEKLSKIGMNVEVQDMDWATLTERRANRGSIKDGGWNMFHTWWLAADLMDPTAIAFSGDRDSGWYGWPKDEELEKYRVAFSKALTQEDKKEIAANVQKRLVEIGALGILGQFFEPVAYSSKVNGITTPVQFYWNMSVE